MGCCTRLGSRRACANDGELTYHERMNMREDEVGMPFAVLLRAQPNGSFEATVPALPGLSAACSNRAEALMAARRALADALAASELVAVDVPDGTGAKRNPWIETAGMFADDPTLEPMLQEIYTARDAE